jgi:hypothetical protein
MRLEEIQDVLRREPFTPFRVFVSDGATYDVRHPELCVPGRRCLFIGMPAAGTTEPVFDRHAIVDLAHVTRLEPLAASAVSGNGE